MLLLRSGIFALLALLPKRQHATTLNATECTSVLSDEAKTSELFCFYKAPKALEVERYRIRHLLIPNLLASPVIGGVRDGNNSFKYHVSIQINYDPVHYTSDHLCGGALITSNYVLSAAHSFTTQYEGQTIFYQPGILKMVVLAGTRQTHRRVYKPPVSKIFIPHTYHAIYDAEGLHIYADIAVLKTFVNVEWNIPTMTTLLFHEGHSVQDYVNQNAFVMGNGCSNMLKIESLGWADNPRRLASYDRYSLEVKMLDRNRCPEFDRAICAISTDTSRIRTCATGDYGSPLVYDDRLIGIYSQGQTLYSESSPPKMIFTRVSIHLNFIRKAMDPNVEHDDIPETVSALTIHNWQDETLDASAILLDLPHLRRFRIVNGNLSRIFTPFPSKAQFLEAVEITGTDLRTLTRRTFADLPALRVLDLRNNALIRIDPTDLIGIPTLRDVYLAGNQWRCDESSIWFAKGTFGSLVQRIIDMDDLQCSTPYKGRPLLPVMEVIQRLREECRQLVVCECELVYVVSSAGPGLQARQRQFMAFASVNCSHRGFTDMPAFLPADTTTLHLEGNKISDLTPLKSNPVYKRVLDLYLDNNIVESVTLLDGAYWLEKFRLFSLRGNKLTDFPTYALENVLSHSESAVSLYLGNNPWRCDCQFTPAFQELLIKYGNLVKDISDVRCAAVGNGKFDNKQIRELSRTEICVSPDEGYWMYPLDILNIILGFLLLLVLGNLSYNYWSFKRTGKLPWIAAKLP